MLYIYLLTILKRKSQITFVSAEKFKIKKLFRMETHFKKILYTHRPLPAQKRPAVNMQYILGEHAAILEGFA